MSAGTQASKLASASLLRRRCGLSPSPLPPFPPSCGGGSGRYPSGSSAAVICSAMSEGMHEIREVLSFHRLYEGADLRIGLEIERAGILDGLGEAQGIRGCGARRCRMASRIFEDQPLQRGARHPAGRGVGGDIEDATRLQPGIGELVDRAPNRWSDPAVDAVERDDVEVAEIGEARLQELVETCFDKADVGQPRGFAKRSRRDDMNRIEIDADKRHLRVRGGENQR